MNLIYEHAHLEYLCIFDIEQQRLSQTWLTKRIVLRILFASLLVPIFAGWFYLYPAGEFHQYFTNWGLVAVFASLCITTYMPYSKNYRKKPRLMAINHFLFTFAILAQSIITIIYWTLLHKSVIKKNSHNITAVIYQYASHSIPAIACLYNVLATDFLFYRGYVPCLVVIGIIFLSTSYISYLISGHVTYWFLDWSDPKKAVPAGALIIGLGGGLILLYSNVTEIIKGRTLPNFTQKNGKWIVVDDSKDIKQD